MVHVHSQAQATVKQAKEEYDKLKDDVTEKISMLNASRCSLLSRSLPSYQEAALEFFENASQELQTVLNDFKSCHHHQYRIKSEVQEEEEGFEEEPKSSTATTHISDSEDDTENNHPLLDLASSDDKEQDSKDTLTACYVDSSYQAVDTFSQLKTVQMESMNKQAVLELGSDSLASPTDDTTWSKLLSSSVEASTDEATPDLNLLKINPSVPLMPVVSSAITSHASPVTSSSNVNVLHSLSDSTSSSPKLRDNWDDLFAELDPLSNEKV